MNTDGPPLSETPTDVLPELKEIVGALLLTARQPLSIAQMRNVLQRTAETFGGATRDFAEVSEPELAAMVEQLIVELNGLKLGWRIAEVAGGFRLENLPRTGPWVRTMLEKGRPNRLSQPALETLAIIAYRQPIVRAEIEAIRGVAVDQVLRHLLDLGLIRIVGRSDLPGRPWLFGTTQKFLELFGLRTLEELPSIEELRRINLERPEAAEAAPVASTEPATAANCNDAERAAGDSAGKEQTP